MGTDHPALARGRAGNRRATTERSIAATLGATLLVLVLLPACARVDRVADDPASGPGGAAGPSSGEIDLPAQDVDRWVMPVDEFVPHDISVTDYAENLLVQECMAESGYVWEVPWVDVDAPPPVTTNEVGRTLFDGDLAAAWGYLSAPDARADLAGQAELNARAGTPEEDEQNAACLDAVRADALPLPSSGSRNLASSLGMAADRAARLDPAVLAAAEEWRACMEPLGVSDLPRDPQEMPSESLRAEFGRVPRAADGAGLDALPVAGPREIEVAVADARCRDTSGWRTTRYQAEWERQVTAVAENADALVRAREESDAHLATARAVVVSRGLG